MTVFKTFFHVLNKNKPTVIIYTVMLLIFGISNMHTSENNLSFVANKPDILIVNNDIDFGITKNLINYIKDNSNIIEIENAEDKINDALFYRDVNYVIYIPKNYNTLFLKGNNPEIEIKSTGDYESSYAKMLLTRYLNVASIYRDKYKEDELYSKINEALTKDINVEMTSKIDTNNLSKATYYYNFASYSIFACLILIIGLILSSFNDEKIRKRIVISKMNYKKHNRILLFANFCYALILWLLYVIISFVIIGNVMFSVSGLLYILNSFILTICVTTISILIGNLVTSKGALNGIVNVIALGSSFLCGAFVPMEWLPDTVLKIAHILPTYYYVSNNEVIKTLETFNFVNLEPIFINMLIIIAFSFLFILLTNLVVKKKRKIG